MKLNCAVIVCMFFFVVNGLDFVNNYYICGLNANYKHGNNKQIFESGIHFGVTP